MTTAKLTLDFLWGFLEPILSDAVKDRIKPKSSPEIAKQSTYELFQILGEIKNKTDTFVYEFEIYVDGFINSNTGPSKNPPNSLRESARELMATLPEVVSALDKVNPQLEIHRNDIVRDILSYRRSRAKVLSELEQCLDYASAENHETLKALLSQAKINQQIIDKAIEEMRLFLKTEFPFKESF
jgi:hypothetical protein